MPPLYLPHRRRIKTEEKANVIASVWGDELHQDDLKEKKDFNLFFKTVLGKIDRAARIE